ncbi:30S ribosomal protein S15 [Patescibacteria group bacterium]|nr:30S ribosomal protein S15 [Patescibacteria group bacterium]MBU2219518.1 30S ribosomal protein S15 [Patescibacteria group bacterium]MBU2265155.1 30S ribosomal protein S15 [Patescibacteria group bacterium]
MLKKQKKSKVIEEFRVHGTDTGSPEVQAAILTAQIKKLTLHLTWACFFSTGG